MSRTAVVAAFLATITLSGAPAAAAVVLASHRAVYDIALDPLAVPTDIADLSGRIVAEFTGSPCAGYKASLRFVLEIEGSDGKSQVTDQRTSSFEDPKGEALDFNNQTYIDDKLAEDSSGRAKRNGEGIAVSLAKPNAKTLDLAGSIIFPTQQIERILAAANAGQSFLDAEIYDGSEDGQKVYPTGVVIGREMAGDDVGAEKAAEGLAKLRHWPVTISYFDKDDPGEATPSYVMSFVLLENGVQRDLKINYGDFAIVARLSSLELLDSAPCP
jgi:hypothetical protein